MSEGLRQRGSASGKEAEATAAPASAPAADAAAPVDKAAVPLAVREWMASLSEDERKTALGRVNELYGAAVFPTQQEMLMAASMSWQRGWKRQERVRAAKVAKGKVHAPPAKVYAPAMARADWLWLLVLTLLGVATRYWLLGQPDEVVFDEVHFGGFFVNYMKGTYFFDIHPPLGKLFLTLAGEWAGFDTSFSFEHIGLSYTDDAYIVVRAMAAFWGVLLVPVTYLNAYMLTSGGRAASVLAAAFVLFDICFLTESRFILTDSCLFFFMAFAILCALKFWDADDYTLRWWFWLVMTGLTMGCAASVKWTGLAAMAIIGLRQSLLCIDRLVDYPKKIPSLLVYTLVVGTVMVGLVIVVYLGCWVVHFRWLTKSGPGDIWHSPEYLALLEGSKHYGEPQDFVPTLWERIVNINEKMYGANAGLKADHHWGSSWLSWPVLLSGVSYWVSNVDGVHRNVYLIGNVVVWWTCALLLVLFLFYVLTIVYREKALTIRELQFVGTAGMCVVAWALNYLPYIAITRVCFLYHYLPCLYCTILLAGVMLHHFVTSDKVRWAIVAVLGVGAAAAFVYWSHLSYGTAVDDWKARRLLKGWY